MTDEIKKYRPDLPKTHGWANLSDTKKTWLQEKTSKIEQFKQTRGIADIGICKVLIEVEAGLEGEAMSIHDYLETEFHQSPRAAYRAMSDFRDLLKALPKKAANTFLDVLAIEGELLLSGSSRIGMKRITEAIKDITIPNSDDEEIMRKTIQGPLRGKIREIRSAHRTGKVVNRPVEEAKRAIFNFANKIMRATKGLKTSADNVEFLETIVGWVMEARAVSGILKCKRLSIPDGVIAKVGYPKGKQRKPKKEP